MYRIRGPQGRIAFLSGAFERLTGWSAGDWIGKPFAALILPEDLPRATAVYEAVRRGERPPPYELRIRTKTGGTIVGEFHSGPLVERKRIVGGQGIVRDVTERKGVEQTASATTAMLNAAVNSSPLAVTVVDLNGKLTLWNRRAEQLFGWRADEVLGRKDPIVPADERAQYEGAVGAAAEGTSLHGVEVRPQRKDGSRLDMSLSTAPLRDAAGQVRGFMALFEDISERKAAEAALRDSEERLRSLFGGIDDALFVHDSDGRIIDCNDAACRRLGYSREELLRMRTSDVDAPEFAAGFRERLAQQLRSGRFSCEGVHVTKDGRRIPVDINSGVIEYHGQKAVLAMMRDITERKRAEDALRESEAKYRSLIEHAVLGVYRSTVDGHMLSANPALVEMLGYASEVELLAQDMEQLYAHPAERQQFIARYHNAERYDGVEIEWKRKDGSPIRVRVNGRPVRGTAAELDGFEMVVEDVTERRQLEDQLRQAQKMEAIGQLAGGVAHDFNNLLTAVLTSCDLLSSELPAGSPCAEDLTTICNAAQRGAELSRKLLAFSRKQPLEVRLVSLAAVANDFLPVARRVVPEDVEVTLRVDVPESTARVDPGSIEQILMNLVTNARDAMPTGGTLTIEVGCKRLDAEQRRIRGWGEPGEYVTLAVRDSGVGMDAETQRRIFEPFFTTKPVGQGTGLGMSMVYGLVKEQDGFVHVSSELGQGTTVCVYFPVVAGKQSPSARTSSPQAGGGSETILLVEDDSAVRRAATRVLRKYGYTVVTAVDGYDALDVIEASAKPPDLVITDVVMPRLSGPHLLVKLRENGPAPRMLFTSGYTARDVEGRTQLEPGVAFLAKPWTVTELLRKVRETLDVPAEPVGTA